MSISFEAVGTGSAYTHQYHETCGLVRIHENQPDRFRLLIECPASAWSALEEQGLDVKDIDGIFISHLHQEVVGGLVAAAIKSRYEHKKKIKLYIPADLVGMLWYQVLRGSLEVSAEGINELRDWFEVHAINQFFCIEGIWFQIKSTMHIPGSPHFSLFMNDKWFYAGHARFDRHLLEHVNQLCDVILHNCQLSSRYKGFAAIDELMTLSPDIQDKMRLIHYDDNMLDYKGRTGRMRFMEPNERIVLK